MATVRKTEPIILTDMFSKGVMDELGNRKIPSAYSPDLRNVRLDNDSTIIRKGYKVIAESTAGSHVRGMIANEGRLYEVADKKLKEVDIDNGTISDASATEVSDTDKNVDFVTYGKYVIILNGEDFPRVWDGSTMTTLTSTRIESGANPRFGEVFLDFTFVAGSGDKDNLLYISRPITKGNEDNSYYWDETNGSEVRTMKGTILGLQSTQTRLYVFTDKTIEVLNGEQTTLGGVTAFRTKPISQGYQVASNKSIVNAGEKVFFFCKDKHIRTINYVQGVTETAVADLSDISGASIQGFLNTLDDDQSDSFAYFDRNEQTIKRHLKKQGSNLNDVIVIYDLANETFLIDDNKFFADATEINEKYYTGSFLNSDVYQDGIGRDDNGEVINWYRFSPKLDFGDTLTKKKIRGFGISGQTNGISKITIEVFVDGDKQTEKTFDAQEFKSEGIGVDPIGANAIGRQSSTTELVDYDVKISKGNLNRKGRYMQVVISGGTSGEELSLDRGRFDIQSIGDINLQNKL